LTGKNKKTITDALRQLDLIGCFVRSLIKIFLEKIMAMNKLLLPVVMLTCLAMISFVEANESAAQQLNFAVFLNDDEIGFHKFAVNPIEGGEAVSIEASFDLEIFFYQCL
jgi:hypothetical protein